MKRQITYLLLLVFLIGLPVRIQAHQTYWFLRHSDGLYKYRNIVNGYVAACLGKAFPFVFSLRKRMPEDLVYKISEMKAKRVFWDAYSTVPAYEEFISQPAHFSTLPFMTKETYLKRYALEKTCREGKLPGLGTVDAAAGAQGAAALSVRGYSESAHMQDAINLVHDIFLDNDSYIFINMVKPRGLTLGVQRDVGDNSADAYEMLKSLGAKHKYLIAGDAACLKLFVKNCLISLKNFDITFLVEGGFVTRAMRTYFMQKGIKKILGGYGIDDIRPLIGMQDEFLQKLQELCWDDPQLAQDLTGCGERMPYFYYYNPLDDYIEEVDGRLIFTDLDINRVSPRIRYDADVDGVLLKMSFVRKILKKHGIELEVPVHLPLMCLWGEQYGVLFNNVLLTFEDLESALLMVPELAHMTNRKTYNQIMLTRNQRKLEYWVELQEGTVNRFNVADLETKLHNALGIIKPAYIQALEKSGEKPVLKIFAYGTSPMPKQKD